jgi:hypothetical protein
MTSLKQAVPQQDRAGAERRREQRHRVFKGARLMFNNGFSVCEAVVRDQSEHGARLKFGDPAMVPTHCMVEISGDKRVYFGRIAWRGGNEVGVQLA